MLTVSVMVSGCMDRTAETPDIDPIETNSSIEQNTTNNVSTLEQDINDSIDTEFSNSDSSNGNHDAYITGYPDRTDEYYLEHPLETEILDDLSSKLDNVISENYILECYIKTFEDDSEYAECNATIVSDRLIIGDPFIKGTVETINYITDTYKINRVQITTIDAITGEVYCKVETSGVNYEDIKLTFKYLLGDEYQITYWNKDLDDYTIEKLN